MEGLLISVKGWATRLLGAIKGHELGAIKGHDQTPANCAARPCLYSLEGAFSAFAALQHASRRFPTAVLQAMLSPPLQGLTEKANCGHRAGDSTV